MDFLSSLDEQTLRLQVYSMEKVSKRWNSLEAILGVSLKIGIRLGTIMDWVWGIYVQSNFNQNLLFLIEHHLYIICRFKTIFTKVNQGIILSEQFCDKLIITRSRIFTSSRVHRDSSRKFQSIKSVRILTISIIINFSLVMVRCGFSSFYGT